MNYAYITVITKDFYLPFLIRQKQLMEFFRCKYPFIVLVSDTVSPQTVSELKRYNIIIEKIPTLKFESDFGHDQYMDTINKFQCFKLINYDKLLFFDADLLITKNFDFIFNKIDFQPGHYLYLQSDLNSMAIKSTRNNKNFVGWVMLIKPSLDFYNQIIKINNLYSYHTDEQLMNEHPLFLQCDNIQFNNIEIRLNVAHFSGIYKILNEINKNDFLNYIFDYTTYSKMDFIIFFLNNKEKLFQYLRTKNEIADYSFQLYSNTTLYKKRQFIYCTFLRRKEDLPFILRLSQRLVYLKSKYQLAVFVLNDIIFDDIKQLQENKNLKIIFTNTFNFNDLNQLNKYKAVYFIPTGFIPLQNIDNEFKSLKLNKIGYNFYLLNTNIIFGLNFSTIPQILQFNQELFIQKFFYTASEIEFNLIIDKQFNNLLKLINSFKNYILINKQLNIAYHSQEDL